MENQISDSILIADDDHDDQYMIKQAFANIKFNANVQFVNDGVELMDYLNKRGKYHQQNLISPRIILLDLNMPKKDGRECLKEIKGNPNLKKIPVIVYSTSSNPDDMSYAYEHGASSYITKPYSYKELIHTMDVIKNYWFSIVKTSKTAL
ncbi:MAG: response regulator [Bacteroidia bacterium]|nr:response regulator [Bacteroidia bacterium]